MRRCAQADVDAARVRRGPGHGEGLDRHLVERIVTLVERHKLERSALGVDRHPHRPAIDVVTCHAALDRCAERIGAATSQSRGEERNSVAHHPFVNMVMAGEDGIGTPGGKRPLHGDVVSVRRRRVGRVVEVDELPRRRRLSQALLEPGHLLGPRLWVVDREVAVDREHVDRAPLKGVVALLFVVHSVGQAVVAHRIVVKVVEVSGDSAAETGPDPVAVVIAHGGKKSLDVAGLLRIATVGAAENVITVVGSDRIGPTVAADIDVDIVVVTGGNDEVRIPTRNHFGDFLQSASRVAVITERRKRHGIQRTGSGQNGAVFEPLECRPTSFSRNWSATEQIR